MNHSQLRADALLQRGPIVRAAFAGAVLVGAFGLSACATSTPPPTAQIAVSDAALAHAVGAGSAEGAPVEMAQARDKMRRAHLALAAKDNGTALALAQQAQVDAQVAEARTEAAKARKSSEALQDASNALKEEMARQPQ